MKDMDYVHVHVHVRFGQGHGHITFKVTFIINRQLKAVIKPKMAVNVRGVFT
jgi:hypothetical protein